MIHLLGLTPSVDEILELPALSLGGHYRARLLARHPAGKATNVARALGHLGIGCRLVGFIGAAEAELFADSLRPQSVACALVPVAAPTRRSTTLLVGDDEVHVNYPSFPVGRAELDALATMLLGPLAPDDTVALSGGLPAELDPRELRDLLTRVRECGARLYVDSSGPALVAAMSVAPDGVRINAEELAEWLCLTGRAPSGDPALDARALLDAGARAAMISLGAEGALLRRGAEPLVRGRHLLDARVYAVGAGDAQLAGWLAARDEHAVDARAELGRALSVAAASVHERLPGVVDRALAERLAAEILWR
jgi:1-phosphofructokinase